MSMITTLAADYARRGGHMHDEGGRHWVWGSLMILFLILLVIAVVWFVRTRTLACRPSAGGVESAEQILAGRFARGEIEADEYHERLAVLRATPDGGGGGGGGGGGRFGRKDRPEG
ncbi:SHOCT domain-containing protein [Embleya sp. AB8]|uniref:SHOCT domain-containing protein n=1 Tax=Embleya sp. AB8 TaxID=3156304 RepID=UPI003C76FCB8